MENDSLIEAIKTHQAEHLGNFARAHAGNREALSQIANVCERLKDAGVLTRYEVKANGRQGTLTACMLGTSDCDIDFLVTTSATNSGFRTFSLKVSPLDCPPYEIEMEGQDDALQDFLMAVEREGAYVQYLASLGPGEGDD